MSLNWMLLESFLCILPCWTKRCCADYVDGEVCPKGNRDHRTYTYSHNNRAGWLRHSTEQKSHFALRLQCGSQRRSAPFCTFVRAVSSSCRSEGVSDFSCSAAFQIKHFVCLVHYLTTETLPNQNVVICNAVRWLLACRCVGLLFCRYEANTVDLSEHSERE